MALRAFQFYGQGLLKKSMVRQSCQKVGARAMLGFLEELGIAQCVSGSAGRDFKEPGSRVGQFCAKLCRSNIDQAKHRLLRNHRYGDNAERFGIRNEQQALGRVCLLELRMLVEIDLEVAFRRLGSLHHDHCGAGLGVDTKNRALLRVQHFAQP